MSKSAGENWLECPFKTWGKNLLKAVFKVCFRLNHSGSGLRCGLDQQVSTGGAWICIFTGVLHPVLPAGLLKVITALLVSQMISRLKLPSSKPDMFSTSMDSMSLDMLSTTLSNTTAKLWTDCDAERRQIKVCFTFSLLSSEEFLSVMNLKTNINALASWLEMVN